MENNMDTPQKVTWSQNCITRHISTIKEFRILEINLPSMFIVIEFTMWSYKIQTMWESMDGQMEKKMYMCVYTQIFYGIQYACIWSKILYIYKNKQSLPSVRLNVLGRYSFLVK